MSRALYVFSAVAMRADGARRSRRFSVARTRELYGKATSQEIAIVKRPEGRVPSQILIDVFGWQIRTRGDGRIAFDDSIGEVSGTWVLGRKPMTEVGLLIYIMVDSVAATCETVLTNAARSCSPSARTHRRSRRGLVTGRKHPGPLPGARLFHSWREIKQLS